MRTLSLCLLSIVLIGTSACGSPEAEQNAGADNNAIDVAGAGEAPATTGGQRFQSRLDGLVITAADSIPPFKGGQAGSPCAESSPGTRQGESVAARGWQVTGEAEVGDYQLVSFVGTTEQGTSGSCLLGDGNIALFQGGDVKALAYAPKGAKLSIGSIQPLETGNIRIFDGDFLSQPMADMHFSDDGSVRIEKVASSENVCRGAAKVPNIYGMPINRARTLLGEAGWQPSSATSATGPVDGRARALANNGVKEVGDCSGTGFGYCQFLYRSSAGTLSVTTAGDDEWPSVAGYSVDCGR